MINLIPPHAKDIVQRHYWMRVSTVWLWLVAVAASIIAILQIPTLVFISGLANATLSRDDAYEADRANLAEFERVIAETDILINHLTPKSDTVRYTDIIGRLDALAVDGIRLSGMALRTEQAGSVTIDVQGFAPTRQALSKLGESVKQLHGVTEVRLPLSNLAKDRDILFTMSVTYLASE